MKNLRALSLVVPIILFSYPASASEGNVAVKLAEKVAFAVLGDVASMAFDAIFGTDADKDLTLDQVSNAMKAALDEQSTKDILGDQSALAIDVADYGPQRGTASRDLEDIMDRTASLGGKINAHINKANSMQIIPAFVATMNTRLAFASERYRVNGIHSDKLIVATNAINALEMLEKFLREDFHDPSMRDIGCIKKLPETKLRINGAVGQNFTEKDVDISTQYCFGNGRVMKVGIPREIVHSNLVSNKMVLNLGGAFYMLGTDLGKMMHEDLWMFAGKVSPDADNNEYFLEESTSKTFAEILRNQYILHRYPALGGLHATVIAWLDIVQATGTHAQMTAALKHGMHLGIGWNTLNNRYHSGEFRNYARHLVASIKSDHELRSIVD